MAKRIEKPVVGKTYLDSEGKAVGIYWTDGRVCHGWRTDHDGRRLFSWGLLSDRNFYDADPTKPEALPALDLSKPVKRRDGLPVRNVVISEDGKYLLGYTQLVCGKWHPSSWALSGRTFNAHESLSDLVQCVRRDWTQADVPFPWPVFKLSHLNDIYPIQRLAQGGIYFDESGIQWPELASDWEYTTDGREWKPCCIWE